MLDDVPSRGYDAIVSWMPHGKAFRVHRPKLFAATVMPRYFKQSKYKSFQRQLHIYGFLRIKARASHDYGAYCHPMFQRENKDLSLMMSRQKNQDTGSTADEQKEVVHRNHKSQELQNEVSDRAGNTKRTIPTTSVPIEISDSNIWPVNHLVKPPLLPFVRGSPLKGVDNHRCSSTTVATKRAVPPNSRSFITHQTSSSQVESVYWQQCRVPNVVQKRSTIAPPQCESSLDCHGRNRMVRLGGNATHEATSPELSERSEVKSQISSNESNLFTNNSSSQRRLSRKNIREEENASQLLNCSQEFYHEEGDAMTFEGKLFFFVDHDDDDDDDDNETLVNHQELGYRRGGCLSSFPSHVCLASLANSFS